MSLMKLKRCSPEDRNHQLMWFRRNPSISPKDTHAQPEGYYYEWVEGECPVRPERLPDLLKFCEQKLWAPPGEDRRLDLYSQFYLKHLVSVLFDLDRPDSTQIMLNLLTLLPLYNWTFTPVAECHGDLTLENVVDCGDRFVFIDPGFHRGLPCRELDEAKLMQSLEELLYQRLNRWRPDSFVVDWYYAKTRSLVHLALLLSHYVRLLRHAAKHPAWRVEHAKYRIEALSKET